MFGPTPTTPLTYAAMCRVQSNISRYWDGHLAAYKSGAYQDSKEILQAHDDEVVRYRKLLMRYNLLNESN